MSEDNPTKNYHRLKYLVVGAIISTVLIITYLFFADLAPPVEDFPIEKFNEGYDILTIYGEHLIKVSNNINYTFEDDTYRFTSIDGTKLKEFNDHVGEINSFTGYGFGVKGWTVTQVVGLDFDQPIYIVERKNNKPFVLWSILPDAHAQVQPFELELQQIRNPEECSRKVIQGAGAYTPFTLKVFYDTTQDRKWDVISKGQTFPVAQQSAQVATFFSQELDQYELYLEINYAQQQERQAYIEVVSAGNVVWNHQEKFDDSKLCIHFHINTSNPPTFPTREELIGDLLTNVDKIPEMIKSFNISIINWNSSIGYMWVLIFIGFVIAVLTLISTRVSSSGLKSRLNDIDASVELVNASALEMDKMNTNFTKNANEIIKYLRMILKIPQVDVQQKKSRFEKFRGLVKHKDGQEQEVNEINENEDSDMEGGLQSDIPNEVKEVLQFPSEEYKEESEKLVGVIKDMEDNKEDEPTGGFIIHTKNISPTTQQFTKEEIPKPEPRPPKFKDIIRGLDFGQKVMKKGEFDKYTYTELNNVYTWISNYRKRKIMTNEWNDIPENIRDKQDIAMNIIYHAIFAKLDRKLKNGN